MSGRIWWASPIPEATKASTTTSHRPAHTSAPSRHSTSHDRLVNSIGIAAAVVACVIFVAFIIVTALCWRRLFSDKTRGRREADAAASAGAEPDRTHGRRRKRVYVGVPIYPTTQLADGDEVVLVPALEDIPEATAVPMPRFRIYTMETDSTRHQHHHTERAGAAVPSSSGTAVNPLRPLSSIEVNAEVCVGTVVSEVTQEEREAAERRWYTQRDYGSAVYYSHSPEEEIHPTDNSLEMHDA